MTRKWPAIVALSLCGVTSTQAQDAPAGGGVSLAQAIQMALSREPAMRAATAEIDVATGLRRQAGVRPNPAVSFERREEPGGADTASEVSVEWPLDLFRRRVRVAAADAEVKVAELEAADVHRQLAADVASAYGNVATAIRELSVSDQVLAAARKHLELVGARASQGSTPTLDRDVVNVDVSRMEAERLAQAGRLDVALLRLKRLLGMSPEMPLRVTQTLEELLAGDIARPTADSVMGRSDVKASEARVLAADARVAAIRQEARPDVTLFGSYLRMDTQFAQFGVATNGLPERVGGQFNYLAAGAMVTLPVFNRQQGNLASAAAERRVAEARAEATRLTAALELAEARVQYEQTRRTVAAYQGTVRPLARRNLDTVRETYELGRATVFDVLAEQRRYLETEHAFTRALAEAYAARISLGRASGDIR